MELTMMKFHLMFTFFTLSQAAYYSRMATLNRVRPPSAFRPGVTLQRPWNHRLVHAASNRAPYVVYRSSPQRYAVKHFSPSTRNIFSSPWKTTSRLPSLSPVTSEYEFVRAASAPPLVHTDGGTGAIHTIPAPNLSLSEKPIVVIDASDTGNTHTAAVEQVKKQGQFYQIKLADKPKPTYEVTEKYVEPVYQMAKIEAPVGFTKTQSIQPSHDLQTYLRNGAALQIASDYGLSAISVPHNPPILPQQYPAQSIHGFSGIPFQQLQQEHTGADSVLIPPNVLYQSDPLFLQKLQQQLMQRFPALEFVPYAAELLPQNPQPNNVQEQQLFLLENEELKQPLEPFQSSESKNVVQRQTQEGSIVTLIPQPFVVNNVTEKVETTTAQQPHNITLELIAAESQPVTTTIKYVIESNTEPQTTQNTTPIYYAQIGQSVGSVIANGFYSAINDVRAAAAMQQVEHTQETTKTQDTATTTNPPITSDLQHYFIQNDKTDNKTDLKVTELKPLLGVPFTKPADSVKVAYTLLRSDEKEQKMTQEGTVYAGQIVEASISEDHDFNNQKATLMKRAPIRLFSVSDKNDIPAPSTNSAPKMTMVKAKIPPKSKLTFDDKTGEPVLRIYASYVDSPAQRQKVTTKLTSLKPVAVTRKAMDAIESWKTSTVKTVDKTQGFDGNQVTQFGLKLRSRSDDYIPLFEDYDE